MEKLYVSQPLHMPLWHVHPSAHLRRGTQQAAGRPLRPARGRHWRRGSRSARTGWSCTCAGSDGASAAGAQERPAAQARTLVVAVDESEESLAAFEWTLRHLFRQGDCVRLLHVLPLVRERLAPGSVYYAPPLASQDFEYEAHAADAAQAHIERMYLPVAARFAAADCRLDVVKAGSQGVAPALCKRAEELQAAVLVLHNHRRTALQTALLGSVSTFCATHCARPVLLVH